MTIYKQITGRGDFSDILAYFEGFWMGNEPKCQGVFNISDVLSAYYLSGQIGDVDTIYKEAALLLQDGLGIKRIHTNPDFQLL
jgi:hypothetical protein